MHEVRVSLQEVRPGEMIVRLGRREINSRFRELKVVPKGTRLVGPRGGQYKTTAAGEAELVGVVTYNGTPVVSATVTAVVLRNEEA